MRFFINGNVTHTTWITVWITWITQNKWLGYVIFEWISGKFKVLISQI